MSKKWYSAACVLLGVAVSGVASAENVELTFNSKIIVVATDDLDNAGRVQHRINEQAAFLTVGDKRRRGDRSFHSGYYQSRITGQFSLSRERSTNRKTLTVEAQWQPSPQQRCQVSKTFQISRIPASFELSDANGCAFYAVVERVNGIGGVAPETPKGRQKVINNR